MKTYILNKIDSLSKWSRDSDVRSEYEKLICDRQWRILNDSNELEFWAFYRDGVFKIIRNGIVSNGTWNYDAIMNALDLLLPTKQELMFETLTGGPNILALKQCGCDECVVLLDSNIDKLSSIESINELETYIIESEKEERKALEEQKEREKREKPERMFTIVFWIFFLICLIVAFIAVHH